LGSPPLRFRGYMCAGTDKSYFLANIDVTYKRQEWTKQAIGKGKKTVEHDMGNKAFKTLHIYVPSRVSVRVWLNTHAWEKEEDKNMIQRTHAPPLHTDAGEGCISNPPPAGVWRSCAQDLLRPWHSKPRTREVSHDNTYTHETFLGGFVARGLFGVTFATPKDLAVDLDADGPDGGGDCPLGDAVVVHPLDLAPKFLELLVE